MGRLTHLRDLYVSKRSGPIIGDSTTGYVSKILQPKNGRVKDSDGFGLIKMCGLMGFRFLIHARKNSSAPAAVGCRLWNLPIVD